MAPVFVGSFCKQNVKHKKFQEDWDYVKAEVLDPRCLVFVPCYCSMQLDPL